MAIIGPVKARVWGGAALLVVVCLASSGCSLALQGAAVAGRSSASQPAATTAATTTSSGPPNLVSNGDFEAGTSPWQPLRYSQVVATPRPHRFGHKALLALPTSAAVPSFGTQLKVLDDPLYQTAYEAAAWVRGSRHVKSTVGLTLYVVKRDPKNAGAAQWVGVTVASRKRPLTDRWQRLSLRGTVPTLHALVLELEIVVTGTVKRWSTLAVDGVQVRAADAP